MSGERLDLEAARGWSKPFEKCKCEVLALFWLFIPHPHNHKTEKAITIILTVTWALWSIGLGSGVFVRGSAVLWGFTVYELFSFTVIYIFGRMHDIEVERLTELANVEVSFDDRGDGDDE